MLTFGTRGTFAGGITFTAGQGTFTVAAAGTYRVTFSITAVQLNQFTIQVNGSTPAGVAAVFGAPAGQPNVGEAILTLSAGDVITLANLTSTGVAPPAQAPAAIGSPSPLPGDVALVVNIGGSAAAVNASFVIEQLNTPAA